MMVIGLTGSIASGKSTAASMLKKSKVPVIDADELAHSLSKEPQVLKEIQAIFGDVFNQDKTLNRAKLGELVFGHPAKLKALEGIFHPKIEILRQKQLEQLKKDGYKVAVYMAPLIFEKGLEKTLDKVILITADQKLTHERIKKRDGLSKASAQKRIDAQMSDEQKRSLADVVIENNGSLLELYEKLCQAFMTICAVKLQNC